MSASKGLILLLWPIPTKEDRPYQVVTSCVTVSQRPSRTVGDSISNNWEKIEHRTIIITSTRELGQDGKYSPSVFSLRRGSGFQIA